MKTNSKKGIVLLMTLMFISTISILILKNLDDSNKYIELSNSDTYYLKSSISLDNLQKEFLKYFVSKKDDLAYLLESEDFKEPIELNYGDMKALVKFENHINKFNLNNLSSTNDELKKNIEKHFLQNNILEYIRFKDVVLSFISKYGQIDSFEQIEEIVQSFIQITKYSEIETIKEDFTFLDLSKSSFVKGNIIVKWQEKEAQSSFIYDVKESKIKGLDIVFQ